jgi:hypothetical protein
MQTGDVLLGGIGLLLLALFCVGLLRRHPAPGETVSLDELEHKVEEQQEDEIAHRQARGQAAP